MDLKEGDLFVLAPPKNETKDLISCAADTEGEKMKLLLIEMHILEWAKGELPEEYGEAYFKMLYNELKKIREKNLEQL